MEADGEQGATISVDEAWAILGKDNISRASVYAAIRRGEIPHLKLGKRLLVPRYAFERWLETAGRE